MFRALYDWTLRMAAHRHAMRYMGAVSFAESSFFPIPPDVMLVPMMLARRDKIWTIALVCTIASVAGGRSALVAFCATMPSQIATHSSQMNAPGPAMSSRTALCELLQNEQRISGFLNKRFNRDTMATEGVMTRRSLSRAK